jgi:hypothetical protein
MRHLLPALALFSALPACATLHNLQLDEIDGAHAHLEPFELHVSEVGIDTKAVGQIASAASGSRAPSQIASIVALFQSGPKTGNVVYDDTFADHVADAILAKCPSARVTGLMSERESTSYYAVSGEYVTVRGFCISD